jgi:hypothetical protein
MSVDGQSDDGNHISERGDAAMVTARLKVTAPIPRTQTLVGTTMMTTTIYRMPELNMLPSQWTMKTKSEADERIVLRHDAQNTRNTMLSERLTSDEDDDSGDDAGDDCQCMLFVREGQVRFFTRPKSRTMRAKRKKTFES